MDLHVPFGTSSLIHDFSLLMEPEVFKDQILPHGPKKGSLQGFVALPLHLCAQIGLTLHSLTARME